MRAAAEVDDGLMIAPGASDRQIHSHAVTATVSRWNNATQQFILTHLVRMKTYANGREEVHFYDRS